MPYKNRADLPESVRDNLPAHAQDIYKEAFNSAWDEYGQDESRAHRVAWGAVERKYHKDPSGKWVEGPTEDRRAGSEALHHVAPPGTQRPRADSEHAQIWHSRVVDLRPSPNDYLVQQSSRLLPVRSEGGS